MENRQETRPILSLTLKNTEVSRLLTAAVVNLGFREKLLSNPTQALDTGYQGEAFNLAADEKQFILSIRATSLSDFATQICNAAHAK